MPPADPSKRAEAESVAGLQPATVIIGDAAAISMEMASVRRRLGELRIEQADLEAALDESGYIGPDLLNDKQQHFASRTAGLGPVAVR